MSRNRMTALQNCSTTRSTSGRSIRRLAWLAVFTFAVVAATATSAFADQSSWVASSHCVQPRNGNWMAIVTVINPYGEEATVPASNLGFGSPIPPYGQETGSLLVSDHSGAQTTAMVTLSWPTQGTTTFYQLISPPAGGCAPIAQPQPTVAPPPPPTTVHVRPTQVAAATTTVAPSTVYATQGSQPDSPPTTYSSLCSCGDGAVLVPASTSPSTSDTATPTESPTTTASATPTLSPTASPSPTLATRALNAAHHSPAAWLWGHVWLALLVAVLILLCLAWVLRRSDRRHI